MSSLQANTDIRHLSNWDISKRNGKNIIYLGSKNINLIFELGHHLCQDGHMLVVDENINNITHINNYMDNYVVSCGFKNSNIHTKCTPPNNFIKQVTNCYDKHCYNVIIIENINSVNIPHNLTEYGIELYYV
jgi:hypothetical protein